MLAVLLAVSTIAIMPIASATSEPYEITWILQGPYVYKAIITINGISTEMTIDCTTGDIRIIEINGVPQKSNRIEHPLLFPTPGVIKVGDRWIHTLLGSEAIIVKWRWHNSFRLSVPYQGNKALSFHIYLDAVTASNPNMAFEAIAMLVGTLAIKLRTISSVEAMKVLNVIYPLFLLSDNQYNTLYSTDANSDGSLDLYIPTDPYNLRCAEWYSIWIATSFSWWIAGTYLVQVKPR